MTEGKKINEKKDKFGKRGRRLVQSRGMNCHKEGEEKGGEWIMSRN